MRAFFSIVNFCNNFQLYVNYDQNIYFIYMDTKLVVVSMRTQQNKVTNNGLGITLIKKIKP